MSICSYPYCDLEVVAHKLCRGHLTQKYRNQPLRPLKEKVVQEAKSSVVPTPEAVTAMWKSRLSRGKSS